MIDLGRIKQLKQDLEEDRDGLVYQSDINDIQDAFDELVATGVELRDDPENATAIDQLEELEDHASIVEKAIYEFVLRNFGENEANDPSWSTAQLAKAINQIPVIYGAEDSKLGFLLGDMTIEQVKE